MMSPDWPADRRAVVPDVQAGRGAASADVDNRLGIGRSMCGWVRVWMFGWLRSSFQNLECERSKIIGGRSVNCEALNRCNKVFHMLALE